MISLCYPRGMLNACARMEYRDKRNAAMHVGVSWPIL